MRRCILGLVALLTPLSKATAFGYSEHCRISNNALSLARASWAARATQAPLPVSGRELQHLSALFASGGRCSGDAGQRTYGDLVAQVDWALSPIDFYLGGNAGRGAGRAYDSAGIPWDGIQRLRNVKLQSFRAMKENAEHFGARALLAFALNHEEATELAARGKLGTALVMNAFADHYLEDHFAPGHIYTPRYGLNDMMAVGMHDHYNRVGAWYEPTEVEALAALFSGVDLTAGVPGFASLVRDACGQSTAADCINAWRGQRIRLLGDDQLYLNPVAEVYITLVIARSDLDVIEAYLRGDASAADAFGPPSWRDYEILPGRGLHWAAPAAALRFGRYAADTGKGMPGFDRSPTLVGGVEQYPGITRERFFVALETPLLAWPGKWADGPNGLFARSTQPILYGGVDAAGYCRRQGCPDIRLGPELRAALPIARINTVLYAVWGDRWSPVVAAGSAWAPHFGGGLEIGFGLLFLGVRVEADHFVSDEMMKPTRLTVTPSLSVALPWRRHRKELAPGDRIKPT